MKDMKVTLTFKHVKNCGGKTNCGKKKTYIETVREDYEIVCNHEDFRWSERWGRGIESLSRKK